MIASSGATSVTKYQNSFLAVLKSLGFGQVAALRISAGRVDPALRFVHEQPSRSPGHLGHILFTEVEQNLLERPRHRRQECHPLDQGISQCLGGFVNDRVTVFVNQRPILNLVAILVCLVGLRREAPD